MNDHILDAASRAFETTFRDFILKWHPELDTALNRDSAAYRFRKLLVENTQCLHALPETKYDEQMATVRETLQVFRDAVAQFRRDGNHSRFSDRVDRLIASINKKSLF